MTIIPKSGFFWKISKTTILVILVPGKGAPQKSFLTFLKTHIFSSKTRQKRAFFPTKCRTRKWQNDTFLTHFFSFFIGKSCIRWRFSSKIGTRKLTHFRWFLAPSELCFGVWPAKVGKKRAHFWVSFSSVLDQKKVKKGRFSTKNDHFWWKSVKKSILGFLKMTCFYFRSEISNLTILDPKISILEQKVDLDRIWTKNADFGPILDEKWPFLTLFDLFRPFLNSPIPFLAPFFQETLLWEF